MLYITKLFLYKSAFTHTSASTYEKASLTDIKKMFSWNWRKLKILDKNFLSVHYKKTWIFQHQHLRQVKMYFLLFLFHCLLPLEYVLSTRLIKNSSKVHEKIWHASALYILANGKYFPQTQANKRLVMACLQNWQ